jgi:hypothetical protein
MHDDDRSKVVPVVLGVLALAALALIGIALYVIATA